MKVKATIYALLAFTLITSCSKSVEDELGESTHFMKVTIGGKEETYSNVSARWIEGGNSLEVTGTKDGSSWVSFSVLSDRDRVPAGTYELDDNSPYTILALHNRTENNVQLNFAATRNTMSTLDRFELNVKNINESTVEGTFSGMLIYVRGEEVLQSIELKNGSFSIPVETD